MRQLLTALLTLSVSLGITASALAADHLDAPAVRTDAPADINDVFAWMNADGTTNLAMTVFPAATADAKFSSATQYVFHTESASAYGTAGTAMDIVCVFDSAQMIQCWSGTDDYAAGDANVPAGLASTNGDFTVFAGLRDDPFYFNLVGFQETVAAVIAAAGSLTFDAAGCPAVPGATATALATQLSQDADGNPGVDFFAPLNTLSIVITIDTAKVTSGGSILSVWGATRTRTAASL